MSDDGRDRFEIPKEMRQMAEASVEQARLAFEKFRDAKRLERFERSLRSRQVASRLAGFDEAGRVLRRRRTGAGQLLHR